MKGGLFHEANFFYQTAGCDGTGPFYQPEKGFFPLFPAVFYRFLCPGGAGPEDPAAGGLFPQYHPCASPGGDGRRVFRPGIGAASGDPALPL